MEQSEFERAMQQLHDEYVKGLPERVAEVERGWQNLMTGGGNAADLRTFIRLAHNLAGSGATYGVVGIGRAARELELYAKALEADQMPTEQVQAEVEERLEALRACLMTVEAV